MMAMQMHKIAYNIFYGEKEKRKNFQLKIGIHKGSAIAGVIGYHKPQFSLIGDTVNTTSRVTSKCLDGCTTVSKAVYDIVNKERWYFIKDKIYPKGLNEMTVFRVLEERDVKPHIKSLFKSALAKMREQKLIQSSKKSEMFFNTLRNTKHQSREERLALII